MSPPPKSYCNNYVANYELTEHIFVTESVWKIGNKTMTDSNNWAKRSSSSEGIAKLLNLGSDYLYTFIYIKKALYAHT